MPLHLEPMPDNPARVAILYGPIVLAGDLGPQDDPAAFDPDYVPALLTGARPPSAWLKPVTPEPATFRTAGVGRPRDVVLRPFYQVHERRYTVYWDLVTPSALTMREEAARVERARRQDLERRTIDQVRVGDEASERAHDLHGDNMETGDAGGRGWRQARDGGWMSYRLTLRERQPQALSLTYWGSDNGGRTFDVVVEGHVLATERLENNRPGQFYDQVYAIPAGITDRGGAITVKFQARPGNRTGGIYAVRVIAPPTEHK
jgi:hypothetical protein